MGKNSNIKELARFVSLAVAHRIGKLMNPNALYAEKYEKESENFMLLAQNVKLRENWNIYDREIIKKEAKNKTISELTARKYLANQKFSLMDEEINKALKLLELVD